MIGPPQWIVLAVALQRIVEAVYAGRNARRLLAAGGREFGRGHYPLFVLLHGGWLAAMFFMVPPDAPIDPVPIGVYVLLQIGRLWVIASLGRFWTTRIVTLPEAPLVKRGPYRFLHHPNYVIVAAELAVLPLAFGAWGIALVASLLNLPLLWWRMRVEDTALSARRALGP